VLLLITRKDLLEAIEKCQGQKNPNANTCIKLAAYYTILDHTPEDESDYSYASEPLSEFMKLVNSRNSNEVMRIMDDLMESLEIANPKLYYSTMERLSKA
jgi:hypothetical protein